MRRVSRGSSRWSSSTWLWGGHARMPEGVSHLRQPGECLLGDRALSGLEASRRLLAARPAYFLSHVYVAFNSVPLGRIDEARAAIAEARRLHPHLSLPLIQ